MAEHRDDKATHDDTTTHDADAVTRLERREGIQRQPRRSHDDVGRAEAADRSRWRFSSAVDAARHLGNSR